MYFKGYLDKGLSKKKEKLTDIGSWFWFFGSWIKNLLDDFQDIGRIDVVSINF